MKGIQKRDIEKMSLFIGADMPIEGFSWSKSDYRGISPHSFLACTELFPFHTTRKRGL